jgi:hypothetical protein
MTEIKKLTKISLIIYTIVTFLYGILNVFLTEIFVIPTSGFNDPFHTRAFGGICFLSSIFAFILLRKNEWEEIKVMYSYLFGLFIPTILLNIINFAIYFPVLIPGAISTLIMGLILMLILFTLGIVSYIQQR